MADKHRGMAVYGADDVLSWAQAEMGPGAPPDRGRLSRPRRSSPPTSTATPATALRHPDPHQRPGLSYRLAPHGAIACVGIGAPALVTLLEHLVGLGVRSFIAVGPAPTVATDLTWGAVS